MPKYCLQSGCRKRSSFNYEGNITPLYCVSHKKPNMISVNSLKCFKDNCYKRPSFNIPEIKTPLYCKNHKTFEMIDVIKKRCLHSTCEKVPTYNFFGEKIGLYCRAHKTDEMIDVVHKRCLQPACRKVPYYNIPGRKVGIYCTNHKTDEMINVINKRCLQSACEKQPSYNIPGKKIALYCKTHKTEEMVDVKSKKCLERKCQKRPHFNLPNEKIGLWCNDHKTIGMINVKYKKCVEKDCSKYALVGLPGLESTTCIRHMKTGMIKNPRKRCKELTCKNIAIYGYYTTATHCEFHHEEGQKNLIEGHCSNCGLQCIVKADGKCEYCGKFAEVKKRFLEKQLRIKQLLEKENLKLFSYDSIIDTSCNKRRPDFVIDAGTHFIIIEVDEYQHRKGDYSCEEIRMFDIAQALGLPTLFIRFNPDNYKTQKGKEGRESQVKREQILISTIKQYQKVIPIDFLTVIYMFYDGWNGAVELKSINLSFYTNITEKTE